jgi:imidazolonepropionase-like amidohydrolase
VASTEWFSRCRASLAPPLLVAAALAPIAAAPATSAAMHQPLPFTQDAYPSTYTPLPRTDTLIRDATVLDGRGGRLEHSDLLLKDGHIVAIGAGLAAPAGARVIDAAGRWVTPGIVDVHTHLGDFAAPFTSADLQHSDVSEATDPVSAQVWAEHSVTVQDPQFTRALAAGVTTVQVLPGSRPLFGGRGVVLKTVPAVTMQAMKFPGAHQSLKMACGENPRNYFGDQGKFPSSRMGNVAGYRAAWLRAQDYLAKWEKYEADASASASPPARDLGLDTLAAVLKGEITVQMHCYRADEMAMMLDLAHEFGYHIEAFHHATEAYKIGPLLAKSHTCAAVWSDWWGFKAEAYDGIRENAAYLEAEGACVALHSDAPMVGQHLPVEVAKAVAAGGAAGIALSHEQALKWITLNPARILHLDDRIGSLEVGKNADVVIWSGDPFSIYTHADQVFIDGALIYDRSDPRRQPRSDFELGQPSQAAP